MLSGFHEIKYSNKCFILAATQTIIFMDNHFPYVVKAHLTAPLYKFNNGNHCQDPASKNNNDLHDEFVNLTVVMN